MQDRALLLAIDTCGPEGSIALGQQLFGKFRKLGDTQLGGRRNSETLIGEVAALLQMAEVRLLVAQRNRRRQRAGQLYRRARGPQRRERPGRRESDSGCRRLPP